MSMMLGFNLKEPGRYFAIILITVALVGIMTYLRLAFEGADVKTAVRLVEEAKTHGVSLRARMAEFIPTSRRLCETKTLSKFYGHMLVTCSDASNDALRLEWKVNVIDGMVVPSNEAALRLGEGKKPW